MQGIWLGDSILALGFSNFDKEEDVFLLQESVRFSRAKKSVDSSISGQFDE
jgi:hypothetical protein